MTVLDLVTVALEELGVLAAGQVPTAEEAEDGRVALNRLTDQWAAERLQLYTVTRTVFTITSGVGSYAVGPAQVVNVARPVFPSHVAINDTSPTPDVERGLSMLTEDQYAAIPSKAQTSSEPASWYYNPTYPYGLLSLFPVPTSTTLQGVLYAPTAVASFAATSTTVALPPGYEEMIVSNLAVRLAPSYGRTVDPTLFGRSVESVATVKRANAGRLLSDLSFAGVPFMGGRWDIYTDSYL